MNNRLTILRLGAESRARRCPVPGIDAAAAARAAASAAARAAVRIAATIATVVGAAGCAGDPAGVAPPATGAPPAPTVVDARPLDGARVALSWPAVRGATRYEVLYAYARALDPTRARRAVVAAHAPAGETERDTLALARPGRSLALAVRARDARGARSALSSPVVLDVPGSRVVVSCVALDGSPLRGVAVELAAARVSARATDAAGVARFDDVAAGAAVVRIDASPWHRVIAPLAIAGDTSVAWTMVPVETLPSGAFASVLSGVMSASADVGTDGVLRRWRRRPVDVFVPDDTSAAGVDYGAEARAAVARWNARTGLALFRRVAAPPDTGVVLHYDPPENMGGRNGFMTPTLDAQGYPLRADIHVVDTFTDRERLFRVFLHELGHAIRLRHLPAGFIMFAGQPLPPDITDDEVSIVRLHEALPNGVDLSDYRLRIGE